MGAPDPSASSRVIGKDLTSMCLLPSFIIHNKEAVTMCFIFKVFVTTSGKLEPSTTLASDNYVHSKCRCTDCDTIKVFLETSNTQERIITFRPAFLNSQKNISDHIKEIYMVKGIISRLRLFNVFGTVGRIQIYFIAYQRSCKQIFPEERRGQNRVKNNKK